MINAMVGSVSSAAARRQRRYRERVRQGLRTVKFMVPENTFVEMLLDHGFLNERDSSDWGKVQEIARRLLMECVMRDS